ncbi:hypothetical protein JCGZ_08405 [Jatropha curcas]|uniref:DUF674 domain-containing protein n=1 Tax=Jatropha curcas TaxID=180498 RepID=A0A067KZV5_JATCU|nr:hypothetical protein JCGZ_08405 [Jatropha curcas]
MATSKSNLRVKLLIDKKCQRVLFAEAGKEFVDFLFSLMSLPLGTVIRLLTKNSMVGCLGKLYESIESLSQTFLQPTQNKESILKPRVPICATEFKSPLLLSQSNEPLNQKAYVCCNFNIRTPVDGRYVYHQYVATGPNSICPSCNTIMSTQVPYVDPAATAEEGSKEDGDLSSLEEKEVDIGVNEGLKLLKESLRSENVLTDVFLNTNKFV